MSKKSDFSASLSLAVKYLLIYEKARAYTKGIVLSVYELFIFPRKDLEVPEIMSIFAALKTPCGTSMPPQLVAFIVSAKLE